MNYAKCPFCQNIYLADGFDEVPYNLQRLSKVTEKGLAALTEEEHRRLSKFDKRYYEACGECLVEALRGVSTP